MLQLISPVKLTYANENENKKEGESTTAKTKKIKTL
jgi:hypothetical protein